MNKPERLIAPAEIKQTVFEGEIIEDYEEDTRGHSCLMLGYGETGRPIHVVCVPKENYLAVITAYIPGEAEWEEGFKKRKG